ncbi:MAG: hypothetical protein ACHQJ6_01155 [Candidatus Berkiellales bacterium]
MSLSLDRLKTTAEFDYYKGVTLPDGRPVVTIQRRPGEGEGEFKVRQFTEQLALAALYKGDEIKNRGDDLFSWLSDLQLIVDLLKEKKEAKRPNIVKCTFDQAFAYTLDDTTKITRKEVEKMRARYEKECAAANDAKKRGTLGPRR